MYTIYFSYNSERTLIGSYNTHEEAIKEGITFIKKLGYTPSKVWRHWVNHKREEWHDFGSWSAFLIVIEK